MIFENVKKKKKQVLHSKRKPGKKEEILKEYSSLLFIY